MDKRELAALVEQAYATFNINMPQQAEREEAVYKAWYGILHDIEYSEARRALLDLAIKSSFMPKPGDIRRTAINSRKGMTQFDDPYVAWGKWMTIMQEVNSGQPPSIQMTPEMSKTVKNLGTAAYGMHTNGDREVFIRVYDQVVQELSAEHYRIPDKDDL